MQGGDSVNVINASLPNITGSMCWPFIGYTGNATLTGAFNKGTTIDAQTASPGEAARNPSIINFDASLSNEIYGKSDKVLPESFALIAQIKY